MDNPLKPSKIPDAKTAGVKDWAMLALQEGQAFLSQQDGFDKMGEIIKSIMGSQYDDKLRSTALSNINLNFVGKVYMDLASALTDVKPFWEFSTKNAKFEQQVALAQSRSKNWWTGRNIDLKFSDCIKYALAGGSCYPHLVYNPDLQDMDVIPEDPRDCIPIRPTDMTSVQNCFGFAIRRERTVNYLKHMYPDKANYIKADRDGSYAAINRQTTASKLVQSMGLRSGFMNNLFSQQGSRPSSTPLQIPVSDVFTIYVKDDSVNMTGENQLMGDASQNWSYIVRPGEPLYPRKRLIVLTPSCPEPLYDGPNIYWHGLFPMPKLTLDPQPWSWIGKSPLKDLLPLQKEIDRTARGICDKFGKYWRPDMVADKRNVSKAAMDRIDTRMPGLRFRVDPGAGAGVTMPEANLQGVAIAMEWLQKLVDGMKELSGTSELNSLVQLGQLPSSETIERMMESMSLSVRLRSRVMEAFLREFAMMLLCNFFQFDTPAIRVAMFGQKGLTFDDFDHDPGTLIPDMMEMGLMSADGNPLPRSERALVFLKNFEYQISPGSLLAASEVTDKLMYLQLVRMGIMDPVTLMEKLKIPNLGLPEGFPSGVLQRLQAMSQMGIGLAPGPASGGGQGGGPGRPASAQAMPRMTVKES